MRFQLLTLAAFLSSLVHGQSMNGLPECSRSCVSANLGGCNPMDVDCICTNKEWIRGLACCVDKGCNDDERKGTIEFAQKMCKNSKFDTAELKCDNPQGGSATAARTVTVTASRSSSTGNAAPTFAPSFGIGAVVAGLAAML